MVYCWYSVNSFSHDVLELADNVFYLYAVMLMGTLVYGIRYTFPEYICTSLVAGGVSTFALMKVRNVLIFVTVITILPLFCDF